ncbi:hypothetical protein D3C85_1068280 [compost metagenome]
MRSNTLTGTSQLSTGLPVFHVPSTRCQSAPSRISWLCPNRSKPPLRLASNRFWLLSMTYRPPPQVAPEPSSGLIAP